MAEPLYEERVAALNDIEERWSVGVISTDQAFLERMGLILEWYVAGGGTPEEFAHISTSARHLG